MTSTPRLCVVCEGADPDGWIRGPVGIRLACHRRCWPLLQAELRVVGKEFAYIFESDQKTPRKGDQN